jgi:putative colanic acid biosynthesis acetyltransferase WcaF
MIDWKNQTYKTGTPQRVRVARLIWNTVWLLLFRPTPYFLCRRWRQYLLWAFRAKINSHVQVFPSCKIWAPWNLSFGIHVAIDDCVTLYSVDKITIGTKVAISQNVFICTASHDITCADRPLVTKPVTICDGVWIGAGAYIGPGVTIGEGAVVGAYAVVTKDVEPWTVVAGNPAILLKKRVLRE